MENEVFSSLISAEFEIIARAHFYEENVCIQTGPMSSYKIESVAAWLSFICDVDFFYFISLTSSRLNSFI